MKTKETFLKFLGILFITSCLVGCSSPKGYSTETKIRHDFGGHGNKVSVKIQPRR